MATGEIRINTSQVDQAGVTVRRVGKEMAEAFKPASNAVKAFGKDIQTMRGEIAAAGLAAAGITAAGLKAAGSLQAARIQLTGMVGSARAATQMIGSLREAANAAGIPFADMLKSARLLLPTLEGNTQQLDTYLKLARRVATLNQQEGVAGASFAINEALASGGTDLVSLSERFQISRFALRDALAETGGDFAKALDMVLTKMGITTEVADEMGRTFDAALRRAADAATQLAGTAFEPLLNDFVIPLLEKGAEWLTQLQQTNPAILQWGAALIGVVAVGAPLLLFLGQIITSLQTIRTLSIAGTLGKAGAFAGIVGLGVAGGIRVLRAAGHITGNEQLANTSLGGAWEVLKKIVLIVAQTLGGLAVQLKQIDMLLKNAWGEILVTLGRVVEYLAQYVGILSPDLAAGLTNAGKGIVNRGQELQTSNAEFDRISEEMWSDLTESMKKLANTLFPGSVIDRSAAADEHLNRLLDNSRGGGVAGAGGPNEDELAAFEAFWADLKEISSSAEQDRLDEEEDYQERISDLSRDYNESREKIVEDAQDRILDVEKRTAEEVASIHEKAADREAKENAAYNERISSIQEDYRKDEARRLEDFQREEQRAKRQHALNLLSAAANLDAKAVWQENMRYKQQRNDRDEDFNVEQERRADQLEERLQQEQEGHEERLQEAREADKQRIRDLQERLEREEEEIRADAERKLATLQEQHFYELAELDAQHQKRLQQINAQEDQARALRQEQFKAELISLDGHYGQLLAAQQQGQDAIAASFAAWWNGMAATAGSSVRVGGTTTGHEDDDGPGGLGGYASGGLVTRTGRAMLHGKPGAPERVLSADMTRMINRMAGGHSDAALLRTMASGVGGGSSRSTSVTWTGDINLPPEAAKSPIDMYQAAQQAIMDFFEEMAGDE